MERTLWTDERLDDAIARIDARFDQVDVRFDRVDARLDALERRMERFEGEMIAFHRLLTQLGWGMVGTVIAGAVAIIAAIALS